MNPHPPPLAHLSSFASPFDTPPVSRSASPSLSLDLKNIDVERGESMPSSPIVAYEGQSTANTSRSSSWNREQSRTGLVRDNDGGGRNTSSDLSIWARIKSALLPSSHDDGLTPKEEEEEATRGRRLSAGTTTGVGAGGLRSILVATESGTSIRKKKSIMMSRDRAQLVCAFALIALVGMNDSATGANLSSMQAHYAVSYDQISIVFLANVAGYFLSCLSSSYISHHIGLSSSLVVSAIFLSTGCLILALAPPFGVFIFSLALLGFGSGLFDAVLTTLVSHEEDGPLMSYMYACFGVGALFSPLIIGAFIDREYPWNVYYYIPLGICILLTTISFFVFSTYVPPKDEISSSLPSASSSNLVNSDIALTRIPTNNNNMQHEGEVVHGREGEVVMSVKTRMMRALRIRAVWAGFLLIVIAFGTSDTFSAWIVSYMIEKRDSPAAASRYQLAGLWGGIATGRVALAYLGRKLGEKTFSVLMLGLASAFLAIIWGVSNVAVDAVGIVFVGFFLGPVTPKVLSMVSARVPPSLKSSVMSLTIGLGLIGSSVGPLAFGVVAGRGGLASLPGVLIGASVVGCAGWMLVPKNVRRED